MNNLLLIIGMIALSNGNISLGNLPLFDNKNNPKGENSDNKRTREKKIRDNPKKISTNNRSELFKFNMNDINRGMKMMDLSDEDLERGMEIITRTKKYMSPDERKILIKIESLLDLVKGIKKLSNIEFDDYEETNFFRSMDEEDKKNMMIKEILEVFPEKRKDSLDKAIDMKKKIDLFAELFLPDDFGEGGFSLSSLVNINNLGSMNNLKLLGSLLRSDDDKTYEEYDCDDEEYDDDDYDYDDEEYDDDDYDYDDEEYDDDDYEDEYEDDDE